MIHSTVDNNFKSELEAIKDVHENQISKMSEIAGRFPVCKRTKINSRKFSYGVQYLTSNEIFASTTYSLGGKTVFI